MKKEVFFFYFKTYSIASETVVESYQYSTLLCGLVACTVSEKMEKKTGIFEIPWTEKKTKKY